MQSVIICAIKVVGALLMLGYFLTVGELIVNLSFSELKENFRDNQKDVIYIISLLVFSPAILGVLVKELVCRLVQKVNQSRV